MCSKKFMAFALVSMFAWGVGCSSMGNTGIVQSYGFSSVEPLWVRNGEPVVYDSKKWYPRDDAETLQDSEVFLIGEYRNIQIFVDKMDVKPYDRLYTKFGVNQYRYYKLAGND